MAYAMRPSPRDLFGEIPVTHAEVVAWTESVAGLAPDSPRWADYVRGYDVVGKIRAAKLAGTFEPLPPPSRLARAVAASRGRLGPRA